MSTSSDIFRIKHVSYKGKWVPILMQNLNGPCPLLAISNALLLQQKISIHHDLAHMDFRQLIHLVGDHLININPMHQNPEMQANQQQQIADALAVLPKLGRGLDVNVRFQKVSDFEYTDELSVLDMLGVNLVHGWLCDPQDTHTASVIKDMSYNQLMSVLVDADDVEHPSPPPASGIEPATRSAAARWASHPSVVSWNSSGRNPRGLLDGNGARVSTGHENAKKEAEENKVSSHAAKAEKLIKAKIVEEFLQDTASQLTYYGLEQLHSGVSEGELCVFFRNNHFCTMCRYDGELYILVTDVGFYDQPDIVWEKLADVSGDNAFCNSNFSVYHPSKESSGSRARAQAPQAGAPKGDDVSTNEPISLNDVQNALAALSSVPGNMIKDAGKMIDAAVKAPSTRTDEHGSGTACGGAMSREHSKEQEDADMALALVLQAEWEEEERRTQQQRAMEQQQQQRSQPPAAVAGRVLAPSAHSGAAVRPPASGAQAPAARQRAGAAGGVAAEQMALYQLAQQERHAEARLREQQHGMQQQHSPTRTSAPAGAQPAQPYYASQTQPQQAQQQGRGPPGSSPTVSEESRRRPAKESKSKKDCVLQ